MGVLYSKLWKKLSKEEELKKIVEKLKEINEFKRSTQMKQKRIIANLILYSVAFYILACVIIGIWFLPESIIVRACLLIPLILVPFIIFGLKNLLSWFYENKMAKASEQYETLFAEKQKILDTIMETETFNKAKTILAQYAPDKLDKKDLASELRLRANINTRSDPGKPASGVSAAATGTGTMASGTVATTQQQLSQKTSSVTQTPPNHRVASTNTAPANARKAQLPLPQPVFPKDRSFGDKLVEYIVGDGPSYRYALICKHCREHNGMALKEEFPYMSFVCCYCRRYNAATVTRPLAPRLLVPEEKPSPPTLTMDEFLNNGGVLNEPKPEKVESKEEEDEAPISFEELATPLKDEDSNASASSEEDVSLEGKKKQVWASVAAELKSNPVPEPSTGTSSASSAEEHSTTER